MQWEDFDWQWALHNVARDRKESETLLFSLVDSAKMWLQPAIWTEVQKQKENAWPQADTEQYLQMLKKQGASDTYIEKERKRILQEQEGSGFLKEKDMGASMEMLVGPDVSD